MRLLLLSLAAASTLALVILFAFHDRTADGTSSEVTTSVATATFVGRGRCAECHEEEEEAWRGSHHDLAMAEATEETVLGDFDDHRFEHFGVASRMFRRDGGFWVHTPGPDGEPTDFRVSYTIGVTPLQQYLVEFDDGRVQSLPFCWDARSAEEGGQRWYHLYPDEAIPHTDVLHWTGPHQNWNFMCADCHTTDLRRNYDLGADRFQTAWTEIDGSCEASHGPGSRHVEGAAAHAGEDEEDRAYTGSATEMGLVTSLRGVPDSRWVIDKTTGQAHLQGDLPSGRQVSACARCHARRTMITDDVHTPRLLDKLVPELLGEGLYHADGQIQDEVYVWGSFVQSKMHGKGVVCTDCHQPHGAGLRSGGNALCYRCHLPDRFDTEQHHHHQPGTPGSQCVDCHMPATHYMVVDPRRDHSLRVPRPDLTVKIGTPNACNGCHEDRSPEWAVAAMDSWYEEPKRPAHFGEALHAARSGSPRAGSMLMKLVSDVEAPAIARATALAELGAGGYLETMAASRLAAGDADPLLRLAAARQLQSLPPPERLGMAGPLMEDEARAVRMEASRAMASVSRFELGEDTLRARDEGLREYVAAQRLHADRAFAHDNLGLLAVDRGRHMEAVSEYELAVRLDPDARNAWANLADAHRALGDDVAAIEVLRRGLKRLPSAAALHHALGLALVRQGARDLALASLQRAWSLDPGTARHGYVLAVAFNDAGRSAEALNLLESVHSRHPADRDVLQGLVTIARDRGQRDRALRYAQDWLRLDPDNQSVQALVMELRARGR